MGLLPQTHIGAVSLDPAWGLPSSWLPETWTTSHKKSSYVPDEYLIPPHRISRPQMSVVNDLTD